MRFSGRGEATGAVEVDDESHARYPSADNPQSQRDIQHGANDKDVIESRDAVWRSLIRERTPPERPPRRKTNSSPALCRRNGTSGPRVSVGKPGRSPAGNQSVGRSLGVKHAAAIHHSQRDDVSH